MGSNRRARPAPLTARGDRDGSAQAGGRGAQELIHVPGSRHLEVRGRKDICVTRCDDLQADIDVAATHRVGSSGQQCAVIAPPSISSPSAAAKPQRIAGVFRSPRHRAAPSLVRIISETIAEWRGVVEIAYIADSGHHDRAAPVLQCRRPRQHVIDSAIGTGSKVAALRRPGARYDTLTDVGVVASQRALPSRRPRRGGVGDTSWATWVMGSYRKRTGGTDQSAVPGEDMGLNRVQVRIMATSTGRIDGVLTGR